MKKHKGKILVLFFAVLLVSLLSCENPFLKKMLVEEEKGNTVPAAPEKPQEPENPAVPVPKYTVSFSVEGTGGTLKARADGIAETGVNPITVEQGKTVTFTAEPAAGYVVKEWKVDGAVVTGNTSNSYTHTVTAAVDVKVSFDAPFVEGGASLILSPDKLTIKVMVRTAGGTPVTVEGCEETTLASSNSTYTVLHAQDTTVILKGKITELYCGYFEHSFENKLTALNVQGLTFLHVLDCSDNQLTALNVQGLTFLKWLYCRGNQLTALDVQGLSNLQRLYCWGNQLTELNVQGCTALYWLYCYYNQLTALDVQGLTALQQLLCCNNQLTELNVQGLSALQYLVCYSNQLTAQAFTKLFDDLPVRADSDDAKCYLYTEESGVSEGNHTDFTAPPDLADAFNNAKNNKKWKMYKRDGSGISVEL